MKNPSAAELLERLVQRADVLVQNLAPGAIDRLGLAPSQLRQRFPSLVICSISGYGSGGPYEQRKAFDLLLQGETGVIATTGSGDRLAKVGISVGDIGAGVYGAMGVLAALLERQQTGQGRIVESSLFDALAEWMGYPVAYTQYGGEPPARAGVRHATVVPYGAYRCGDGNEVLLAVQTEKQWSDFCSLVCGHPEWVADPRFDSSPHRRVNRVELEQLIEEALSGFDRAEVTRKLEAADIPYGDLNSVQQFIEHPQLIARDRWRAVQTPMGPIEAILPPITMEGIEGSMGEVPAVGEHTDAVLREIGYDAAEIESLHEAGAV
jgi:crotonobetainyl-CoA:carnitine CoA-transferase CaiB-like acyl-CoA transferase